MYCQESGNILGYRNITLPEGHTWKSFTYMILQTMPPATKDHFENKIAVFLKWWLDRGYKEIPDFDEKAKESAKEVPTWRRICKALLRNDYWCKGLSFSQHKSGAYEKYVKLMKKRREEWKII
jgi:predicted phosphoadenosine phosphosulfate sulfurtransferase